MYLNPRRKKLKLQLRLSAVVFLFVMSASSFVQAQSDQDAFSDFSDFAEPSTSQNLEQEFSSDAFENPPIEEQSSADSFDTDPFSSDNTALETPAADPFPEFGNEEEPTYNYTESQSPVFDVPTGSVTYETTSEATLPYKQRRKTHGVLFTLLYEKMYPLYYESMIDLATADEFLDGSAVGMFGAELGYKYNFSLGSLALLFQYTAGQTIGNKLGYDRSLHLTKKAAVANFALDAIMNEPYLVPYVQGSVNIFDAVEDDPNFEANATTGMVLGYRLGLLFQLDWIERSIDKRTHEQGLVSSGLQNTYLDVFINSYMAPSDILSADNPEGSPNISAEAQFGLGLKMEF